MLIIEDLNPQEEIQTSELIDSKDENLYWETDDTNPNQVIYDLENNQTIIPTSEEEILRNFSTIEPETENIFQEEDYVPSLSDEEIMNMNQDEYERNLDMEDEFDGFVPEPFATPEEVEELKIDVKIEIPEDDERMNIIGQNGNEGLHYENEETTSSEQDDEKKN